MPIAKGQPWGHHAPLPPDGVIAASDAAARAEVETARRRGGPVPVIGLTGGDLCRTVGGTGDAGRLHGPDAMTFPIDAGSALLDGRQYWFVAHLVARDRWWGRVFVAMNAQWHGSWNLGPRAHPDDGLLDCYTARLSLADRLKVRARLATGTHLPHPGIASERTAATQVEFDRPRRVWLDGVETGLARRLVLRVEPDAISIVV